MPAIRTETGQFMKGCSGNPSGRPKQTDEERDALEEIKQLTPHAVDVLRGLMTNKATPPAVRLKACEIVLNRAYGTPRQALEVQQKMDFSLLDAIHYGEDRSTREAREPLRTERVQREDHDEQ